MFPGPPSYPYHPMYYPPPPPFGSAQRWEDWWNQGKDDSAEDMVKAAKRKRYDTFDDTSDYDDLMKTPHPELVARFMSLRTENRLLKQQQQKQSTNTSIDNAVREVLLVPTNDRSFQAKFKAAQGSILKAFTAFTINLTFPLPDISQHVQANHLQAELTTLQPALAEVALGSAVPLFEPLRTAINLDIPMWSDSLTQAAFAGLSIQCSSKIKFIPKLYELGQARLTGVTLPERNSATGKIEQAGNAEILLGTITGGTELFVWSIHPESKKIITYWSCSPGVFASLFGSIKTVLPDGNDYIHEVRILTSNPPAEHRWMNPLLSLFILHNIITDDSTWRNGLTTEEMKFPDPDLATHRNAWGDATQNLTNGYLSALAQFAKDGEMAYMKLKELVGA